MSEAMEDRGGVLESIVFSLLISGPSSSGDKITRSVPPIDLTSSIIPSLELLKFKLLKLRRLFRPTLSVDAVLITDSRGLGSILRCPMLGVSSHPSRLRQDVLDSNPVAFFGVFDFSGLYRGLVSVA
jgi:hypothetical protein